MLNFQTWRQFELLRLYQIGMKLVAVMKLIG
jgi:hypothetical protein